MRRNRPRRPSIRAERGQTSFDFLVGMSVFLLALGFAFSFVPGMFDPFTSDTGEHMIVADRSAARLSEHLLVESMAEPGVLNESCTVEFFDEDGTVGDCRFDSDGDDLTDALGIDTREHVNVTVQANDSIRSLSGTRLNAGPPPGTKSDLIVARRMVSLGGNESTVYVRVW